MRLINCRCSHFPEAHHCSWDKQTVYCMGDHRMEQDKLYGSAIITIMCKCQGFVGDNLAYMEQLYEASLSRE